MAERRDFPRLTRLRNPMPQFVRKALETRSLAQAFEARPPYQQDDYLSTITSAKRQATVERRLAQMLDALEAGDRYMNMRCEGTRG